MQKIFIETSVFIRFLIKDDPAKYKSCVKLFESVSEGKLRPYTSNIVVMEIVFILMRHYKFPKTRVLAAIDKLLKLRNLTLIEKTDSRKALKLFSQYSLKYGDFLIAIQVPKDVQLITYDRDFLQISSLETKTPNEIMLI